jgi:uncharacterized protein involved in outer membrane biogenesis
MSTGRKIGLAIACVIVAFVVAVVFIAPRFVQLDRYRPNVISYIEQQTGRRVEIGHLVLTILPVIAIQLDHFAIANPPGFPQGNWLVVRQIDARLDFGALLHGQIVIRALKLEHPVLDLLSDHQGHWNFQIGPPPGPVRIPPGDPPLFIIQKIIKLRLDNGDIRARELQPTGQPGPAIWNAEGLSLDLGELSAPELNALGGAEPPAPANSQASKSTTGQLSMRSVGVSNLVAVRVETNIRVSPTEIHLKNLHFGFYGGHGRGTVTLVFGGPLLHYQGQAQLAGVDIAKVLAEFPSTRGQMTGTLNSRAAFSGSSTSHDSEDSQAEGTLTIREGTWPKLKLDPTLIQLLTLAQLGSASADLTRFSLISAQWRLAAGVVTVTKLHIVDQGAVVDSSGTVDLSRDDRLDFQGVLRMTAHRNELSNLLAGITGGHFQGSRIDVPFVLTGTVKKPALGLKTTAPSVPSAGTPGHTDE